MKNELLSLLPLDFPWRASIHCLESVDSTSTYAKKLAKDGAPHGTVILAKEQTGGRGRMGRSFLSPVGGLYMTILLRPQCKAEALMHLTCATGVTASDAVYDATGIRPGLKWINDLVLGTKKVGGILAEMSLTNDGYVDYALIGIGINCLNPIPAELSQIATSLTNEGSSPVSPVLLAARLLLSFYPLSNDLLGKKDSIMETYRQLCVTTGKEVLLLCGEERKKAFALSITDDGGLLVEYPDKTQAVISSGEASVRGLFGYLS